MESADSAQYSSGCLEITSSFMASQAMEPTAALLDEMER